MPKRAHKTSQDVQPKSHANFPEQKHPHQPNQRIQARKYNKRNAVHASDLISHDETGKPSGPRPAYSSSSESDDYSSASLSVWQTMPASTSSGVESNDSSRAVLSDSPSDQRFEMQQLIREKRSATRRARAYERYLQSSSSRESQACSLQMEALQSISSVLVTAISPSFLALPSAFARAGVFGSCIACALAWLCLLMFLLVIKSKNLTVPDVESVLESSGTGIRAVANVCFILHSAISGAILLSTFATALHSNTSLSEIEGIMIGAQALCVLLYWQTWRVDFRGYQTGAWAWTITILMICCVTVMANLSSNSTEDASFSMSVNSIDGVAGVFVVFISTLSTGSNMHRTLFLKLQKKLSPIMLGGMVAVNSALSLVFGVSGALVLSTETFLPLSSKLQSSFSIAWMVASSLALFSAPSHLTPTLRIIDLSVWGRIGIVRGNLRVVAPLLRSGVKLLLIGSSCLISIIFPAIMEMALAAGGICLPFMLLPIFASSNAPSLHSWNARRIAIVVLSTCFAAIATALIVFEVHQSGLRSLPKPRWMRSDDEGR